VTAEDGFARLRHGGVTGAGDRVTLEAFVNGEPEDERITGGEASLHLGEGLNQSLITDGGVFCRLGIRSRRRFGFELTYTIWPHRLGTGALFGYGLDPVTEHGAGIGVNRAFDDAFVVVNEETRGDKDLGKLLFHLVELDSAGDGVGGARSELALVVNGRAFCAEIDLGRKGAQECWGRGVKVIALIGDIGDPAVAFDFTDTGPSRTGGSDAGRAGPSRTGGWGRAAFARFFSGHEDKLFRKRGTSNGEHRTLNERRRRIVEELKSQSVDARDQSSMSMITSMSMSMRRVDRRYRRGSSYERGFASRSGNLK
jgi:hypothetical protein